MRREKLLHFSHEHPLREIKVKESDYVACSCCKEYLSGTAFACKHSSDSYPYSCDFSMHKSCLDLPQQIYHKSHRAHPLTLNPSPGNDRHEFKCDACGATDSGFTYQCSICDYDLHVKCSSLPETVKREEHEHPLSLLYSIQNSADNVEMACDVCDENFAEGSWAYGCVDCDFGAHLDCGAVVESKDADEKEEEEEREEEITEDSGSSDPVASANELLKAQLKAQQQMNILQFQMQQSQRQAQMMHSFANGMRYL